MSKKSIHHIKSISEYHRWRNLPKPEHPLVSVINFADMETVKDDAPTSWMMDFYCIALKRDFGSNIKYGQMSYDFDEGVLFFISPRQVFSVSPNTDKNLKPSGWMLLVHPDFLWNTTLADGIKKYGYFDYAANEALFLSDKEEAIITGVIINIKKEYHNNIDDFSQNIIISQIETLLNYAERFYRRQFVTRKISHRKILDRLEELLDDYFNNEDLTNKGLPTVQQISEALNLSPNYLHGLLKNLTGRSTQQHIHDKLIAKAKEKLSTTELSIGEIAYGLGFEHSQSFSRLFKNKTKVSPNEFRNLFH